MRYGYDPLWVWNLGRNEDPKPRNPQKYRAFLFAAGAWLTQEDERRAMGQAIRKAL